jgi:hypothetical protein
MVGDIGIDRNHQPVLFTHSYGSWFALDIGDEWKAVSNNPSENIINTGSEKKG